MASIESLIDSRDIPGSKMTEMRLEHPWKPETQRLVIDRGRKRYARPEVGASDASHEIVVEMKPRKQICDRTKTRFLKKEPRSMRDNW
jgi:hypothetical protein